jgi:hypothetical protein
MLVTSGLEIADAHEMKVNAMSSEAGLYVYRHLESEVFETESTDYSPFEGKEPLVYHFLIRRVRASYNAELDHNIPKL